MKPMSASRRVLLGIGLCILALAAGGAVRIVQDQCGPFTDVTPGFCPYVLELYYLGITVGTSATTFSPDDPLTRGQAAVFISKGLNQSLARSSRRAALGQWWTTTPQYTLHLGITGVPFNPLGGIVCDGADVWAASSDEFDNGAVTRIRASDGRFLERWTLPNAYALRAAMGRIFVSTYGGTGGHGLYVIDPTQSPAPLSSVIDPVAVGFFALAFDGARIWGANGTTVSIITPSSTTPWPVTVTTGVSGAMDLVFDGSHVWAVDVTSSPGSLVELDESGNVLKTASVGSNPRFATFDGANIWVPNLSDNSVTVVQASTGVVLATLTGNGLNLPWAAAFDGQRVLVTSLYARVSLFKAADLSPIGSVDIGLGNAPYQACSDGTNFFISVVGLGAVARY